MNQDKLAELCDDVLRRLTAGGASDAKVVARAGQSLSVKVRMGHRSIQTTDRYLHLLEGQAAEDVEALESEFPAAVGESARASLKLGTEGPRFAEWIARFFEQSKA